MAATIPQQVAELVAQVATAAQAAAVENTSEQHITYTQTYEIRTKVGAEVDSKGQVKPSAQVEVTRKLENGDDLYTLIHADMQRGLEEVQAAITEVLKRGGGQ